MPRPLFEEDSEDREIQELDGWLSLFQAPQETVERECLVCGRLSRLRPEYDLCNTCLVEKWGE